MDNDRCAQVQHRVRAQSISIEELFRRISHIELALTHINQTIFTIKTELMGGEATCPNNSPSVEEE